MVTFQLQAVTVDEPATVRDHDLKIETSSENKLCTVAGTISRILVEQLHICPFLAM
jgi:hypothetical protein